MQSARMFGPISVQSAKVIRVSQLRPKLLENLPIFLRAFHTDLADEVALEICCHAIVIKQRVIYIEQEDDTSWRIIAFVHFFGIAVPLIAQMPRACYPEMQQELQRRHSLSFLKVVDKHCNCRSKIA